MSLSRSQSVVDGWARADRWRGSVMDIPIEVVVPLNHVCDKREKINFFFFGKEARVTHSCSMKPTMACINAVNEGGTLLRLATA